MRPIPLKLLPNSVIYREYQGNTGEGVSFADDVTLSNVKIEERKTYVRTTDSVEVVGNAFLFYDLVNSSGLSDAPIPQSKIEFDDKEYIVIDTDVLRGNSNTPHHYEVMLK